MAVKAKHFRGFPSGFPRGFGLIAWQVVMSFEAAVATHCAGVTLLGRLHVTFQAFA